MMEKDTKIHRRGSCTSEMHSYINEVELDTADYNPLHGNYKGGAWNSTY